VTDWTDDCVCTPSPHPLQASSKHMHFIGSITSLPPSLLFSEFSRYSGYIIQVHTHAHAHLTALIPRLPGPDGARMEARDSVKALKANTFYRPDALPAI